MPNNANGVKYTYHLPDRDGKKLSMKQLQILS